MSIIVIIIATTTATTIAITIIKVIILSIIISSHIHELQNHIYETSIYLRFHTVVTTHL